METFPLQLENVEGISVYMKARCSITRFFMLQIFLVNYTEIVHNEYYIDLILQYRCTLANI